MSIYDKPPLDPKLSWLKDDGDVDPTEDVSFALLNLLQPEEKSDEDTFDDPLTGIYPYDYKGNRVEESWNQIHARQPEMLARKPPGVAITSAFNAVFDSMKGDRERVTKISRKLDRLSNQLFDLEQSQDDELDFKLADFLRRHEPDTKEVKVTLEQMEATIDDLVAAQANHASELAHHAQDTGLALADLTLSSKKSHNMNVKERCAMYFVTGKLTEIKDDLHKNSDADEELRNIVEKMKTTLNQIIESNRRKLERKREIKRRKREARLGNGLPGLDALNEKLEHLKLAGAKIEERAQRQAETMKKREAALDILEDKMIKMRSETARLDANSSELASKLKEYLNDDSQSMSSSLMPAVKGSKMSINPTVNGINAVAKLKSAAALFKAKSFRNASEMDITDKEEKPLEEEVAELLDIKLTEDHPEEAHEIQRDLRTHREIYTKHKEKEAELKKEMEKETSSFNELKIENDAFEKQIAKEKEVHERRLDKHAQETKEVEELRAQEEEEEKKKKEAQEKEDEEKAAEAEKLQGEQNGEGDHIPNGEENTDEEFQVSTEEGNEQANEGNGFETVDESKPLPIPTKERQHMADPAAKLMKKKGLSMNKDGAVRLIGRHSMKGDDAESEDGVDKRPKKVKLPLGDMNKIMKGIAAAEKAARLDRARMEKLNQYLETLKASLAEIKATGDAWDEAVRVLEAAMAQVEELKLDKDSFALIKERVAMIEKRESERDLPGRLKVSDLVFRLPAVERAVADLRVKGVLEQQIEMLAVTKADAAVFTGQIAAMSGSLRAMVNDVRHSDHHDVNNALKSIATRLDNEEDSFEALSKRVEQSSESIMKVLSEVKVKSSPPVVMNTFREEASNIIQSAMTQQAKKIAAQGAALKEFRDRLVRRPREGMVQQYMSEIMDTSLARKDKDMSRLTSLVEQLREETSQVLSREELTNIVTSRVFQLLNLGFDASVTNTEESEKIVQAALAERPGIRGNRRTKPPQQSALLKNKKRY